MTSHKTPADQRQDELNAEDELRSQRAQFEQGNQRALFDAIAACATADIKMPEWVRDGFISGYLRALQFDTDKNSWDEIFGRPYPDKTKPTKARLHAELTFPICLLIEQANARGTPIDDGLFSAVAQKLKIGKLQEGIYAGGSTVRDIWRANRKRS